VSRTVLYSLLTKLPGSFEYRSISMHNKLWFVTDGVSLISVHENRSDAEREYEKYRDDPDFEYYDFYVVEVDELEDYPDEYDFALDQGLVE